MAESNVIRVLIFGATGVGKTSLCNTLANRNRPTNNGPLGVTEKTHIYPNFLHRNQYIQIIDTAGLHESNSGTVPADIAIQQIIDLLQKSKDGFNILLHVARASRITKQQEEDHDFFVNRLAGGKVPALLILTGCENEEPMSSWPEVNGAAFETFKYKKLIASCFATGGKFEAQYAPLRDLSRTATLDAIVKYCLADSYLLYGGSSGRTKREAIFNLWNEFIDWANLPKDLRKKTNETAYELLVRLGVSKKIADVAIKHLPDLAEEIGSKIPVPGAGKVAKLLVAKLLSLVKVR